MNNAIPDPHKTQGQGQPTTHAMTVTLHPDGMATFVVGATYEEAVYKTYRENRQAPLPMLVLTVEVAAETGKTDIAITRSEQLSARQAFEIWKRGPDRGLGDCARCGRTNVPIAYIDETIQFPTGLPVCIDCAGGEDRQARGTSQ